MGNRIRIRKTVNIGIVIAVALSWIAMTLFRGANLFFHMIIPVVAMAEVILLSDAEYTKRDNNLTVIPPLIYGTGYLANVLINGIGEWPDTNDWYLFLAWGYPVGILIFACICLITWLLALAMRKIKR